MEEDGTVFKKNKLKKIQMRGRDTYGWNLCRNLKCENKSRRKLKERRGFLIVYKATLYSLTYLSYNIIVFYL
jgi:hypothetical protein